MRNLSTTMGGMPKVSSISVATEGADSVGSLDDFLASVERRAYRMAQVATGDREAALDIVQDSMMKLVQSYSNKTAAEWRPLFFRILHNCINDWHRSQTRRWAVFDRWFGSDNSEGEDPLDQIESHDGNEPDGQLLAEATLERIDAAIRALSPRQQQTFMLRCWEGMSTAETAAAMDCTLGTVKTLYSRAMASINACLQEGEQSRDGESNGR